MEGMGQRGQDGKRRLPKFLGLNCSGGDARLPPLLFCGVHTKGDP